MKLRLQQAFFRALAALWATLLAGGCLPAPPTPAASATFTVSSTAPAVTKTAPPASTKTLAPTPTATPTPTPTPVVLVGAGDISVCGLETAGQTAALLAGIPGEIFTAGDNATDRGRLVEYTNCFAPSWGRFLERIHPAPGNHDYMTHAGQTYFEYFGAAAGEPGKGWYSYRLGKWHIVALNSNCDDVSCKAGSPQVEWLRQDLRSHPSRCSLAYFHHPRWSSGLAGSAGWMSPFWRVLYENGVDVVVGGHDHDYERLAPMDPDGNLDRQRGIRQFVAGTGGAALRPFAEPVPNSEVRIEGVHGVLKFTLYPEGYDWEFLPVGGGPALDSGLEACRPAENN